MKVTVTKCLTGYFNTGDGKRESKDWLAELRALSADEKRALAEGVCAITGDELADK